MLIIDAQLHDIGPRLAWEGAGEETKHGILTEIMLGWMDAVGIQATVVNSFERAWLLELVRQFPQRIAAVLHTENEQKPEVEQEVARLKDTPGVFGHRISFGRVPWDPEGVEGSKRYQAGVYDHLFAACQKYDRPLFCSAFGSTHHVGDAARRFPRLRLVVDHMGIAQPPLNPRPQPPWRALPELLAVASQPNVYVKLCGAPVLSDEGYPFADMWPHVHQIIRAFGIERVMWASDIGRFEGRIGWANKFPSAHGPYPGKHNYAESLFAFLHTNELSSAEKEQLLAGTVRRLTGWSPQPIGS